MSSSNIPPRDSFVTNSVSHGYSISDRTNVLSVLKAPSLISTPDKLLLATSAIPVITGNPYFTRPVALFMDSVTGQVGIQSEPSLLQLKDNVVPLSSRIDTGDTVDKLQPVQFEWKGNNVTDIGLIAEEVQQHAPSLAKYDEKKQLEGVKYSQLPIIILQEIKSLRARVAELESQIIRNYH